jgi:hypothetical protein
MNAWKGGERAAMQDLAKAMRVQCHRLKDAIMAVQRNHE